MISDGNAPMLGRQPLANTNSSASSARMGRRSSTVVGALSALPPPHPAF
jgi:hypothetical protein